MATFSKIALSGSTNGKGIPLTATSTPGTLIHTAQSGTTNFDNVKIYVQNIHTADVDLTVEWGGTANGDKIIVTVPFKSGLILVIPSLVIQNSLIVRGFASVTAVLNVFGYVNRIS